MMADERKGEVEALPRGVKRVPRSVWQTVSSVGREDPRRAVHSLKVGIALALVSVLYLHEPLYAETGGNMMWAVMTVVVVLEFTAGATLYKGLNRGLGTVLAGSLAFSVEYVSRKSNGVAHGVFIGSAVFVIGTVSTYMRFFPYVKKNYDYGIVIFLLTFNLITVSSYRLEDVLKIAHQRFYTIAIGCAICLVMSLLVFPYWSGDDLHNSMVSKLEGLARSIEACVVEYFSEARIDKEHQDDISEDPIYKGFKTVLDSKSADEAQAVYASWEPRCRRNCCALPWKQYVKLGAVLRHFGYTVMALHGCLRTEIQTPRAVRVLFKDPCTRVAVEVTKVLLELANSVRNRRRCSPDLLSEKLHESLQDLNHAIKPQPELFLRSNNSQTSNMLAVAVAAQSRTCSQKKEGDPPSSTNADTPPVIELKKKGAEAELQIALMSLEFSEALPFAAFVSLLVEMVARLDLVIDEEEELSRVACFEECKPADENVVDIKCEQLQPRADIHRNCLRHGLEA